MAGEVRFDLQNLGEVYIFPMYYRMVMIFVARSKSPIE